MTCDKILHGWRIFSWWDGYRPRTYHHNQWWGFDL